MIDIHHHCLPGVDDGPKDWDAAIAQCLDAVREGIETIVATPHVLRGAWQNSDRAKITALVTELQERVGSSPRILLGCEYFFAHDILELLREGRSIIPLADSRYVLIELASNAVPPMLDEVFFQMQLDGWIPVIAHPERNLVLQAKPDLLHSLVARGARTQITAGSLTGQFGRTAERSARDWLIRGLVHVVATDAHSLDRRPPRFRDARAVVGSLAGERAAQALFYDNPKSIIENNVLAWESDGIEPHPRNLMQRLQSFLSGKR